MIQGAIRLSSNVIGKNPKQFASQILGRLLTYSDMSAIQEFGEQVVERAHFPWLRPLWPALHPPGTGLLCTLTGHTSSVTCVALSGDGRIAVSASWDQTLKVWEVAQRARAAHPDWRRK